MNAQPIPAASAVDPILQQLKQRLGAAQGAQAQVFACHFFKRVSDEDIASRPVEAWTAVIAGLFEFVRVRKPGTPRVRVFNPTSAHDGYDSHSTAIDIITDDMPFLVDSVSIALSHAGLQVHSVVHPVYSIERDPGGHILNLSAEGGKGKTESLMHFEVDRIAEAGERSRVEKTIAATLEDVAQSVSDWRAMRDKMIAIADDMAKQNIPIGADDVAEAQHFLRWAADDNFTFLGYREYKVGVQNGEEVLLAVDGSGLGIFRGGERSVAPRSLKSLAAKDLPLSGALDAIILTKTNARSSVHRPGYMDYIGVLKFDDNGVAVVEQRFLGLFASGAYTRRPWEIPLVRQKFDTVMKRSGLRRDSHSGKALRNILETLPRDELFQAGEDELFQTATGIMQLQGRTRSRLFVRRDKYGRFFSCLVYIPRDRFTTDVREKIESLLKQAFHGERVDSAIQVGESPLARLHLIVRPRLGEKPAYEHADLETRIANVVRNWHDSVRDVLTAEVGEQEGAALANRYAKSLPAGYVEEVSPESAAADVRAFATLQGDDDIRMSLYEDPRDRSLRFKVIHFGEPIPLSDALPMLENMGLKMLAEHVYTLQQDGRPLTVHDFEVRASSTMNFDLSHVRDRFEAGFEAVWRGQVESDSFNQLMLSAQLESRQVAVLRGLCKYMLQTGVPFSQTYMEETLNRYPLIAGLLVELFEARLDPNREDAGRTVEEGAKKRLRKQLETLLPDDVAKSHSGIVDNLVNARSESREAQQHAIVGLLKILLDGVASIDEDRILRGWLGVIQATLRTSFYQTPGGKHREYISFKFDPSRVPDLPKPKPYREIFVYAPRVEGVHLRFGPVARGGLRWSDRREDFRTEVLGLVKAQMVKNTVIVPVGSKGGFFVKRPPVLGDRDAILAEGVACYRLFINGLLDITDNLVDGNVVHPQLCVRHDGDDPYLVVAADKGTATFSDIANAVSAEHGYWLGDAFASGGSVGYDHKAMGITAKGAWESVKRHFRSMGRDCQTEDFTTVGIGDMSGDVFGNGMLLSRHTRLLAAFDHRHIFLDPNPDAEKTFVERERMFKLPRSSWADYDPKVISKGGGVFPRSAKSIAVSPEIRAVLGIEGDAASMSPNELMRAILRAPVDLLWNGGIGTYVKAESETSADAGDRANNAIRLNGRDLRCKLVGEGGNLGFTQRGRIEAALNGVLLNTDFIDNSAGVDTSDHEVNIKILLNDAVQRNELTYDARNKQLAAMTDEVERLVLLDNYRQNQAISLMERMSVSRLGAKQHFIKTLESEGLLDRALEFLPSDAEFAERKARGTGLTRPELSILLSYSKIVLFQQLLDSDVPEDSFLSKELRRYFPGPLQEKYAEHMERHRLKREIIATAVTNSMVNRMGATFVLRMGEDTGKTPAQVARAFNIAREVLDAREMWAQIEALDGKVNGNAQIDALLVIWSALRNQTRWLLNHTQATLDIAAAVQKYHAGMRTLRACLADAITPREHQRYDADKKRWIDAGFPASLASDLAVLPTPGSGLDIVAVAAEHTLKIERAAEVYFALGEALHLSWLMGKIEELPVESRWHAHARGSLRDELYSQHRALTAQVLEQSGNSGKGAELVEAWLNRDDPALKFTLGMFADMRNQVITDYPIVSVAVRRLAQLLQTGSPRS
jgi:glutamate dehydrogenase